MSFGGVSPPEGIAKICPPLLPLCVLRCVQLGQQVNALPTRSMTPRRSKHDVTVLRTIAAAPAAYPSKLYPPDELAAQMPV